MSVSTAQDAQEAVLMLIKCTNEISGEQKNTKPIREKIRDAKQAVIEFMRAQKVSYIDVKGTGKFILLEQTQSKPTLNEEFFNCVIQEFYKQPNFQNMNFGQFVTRIRDQMSEPKYSVKITEKKPLAAILQQEVNGGR